MVQQNKRSKLHLMVDVGLLVGAVYLLYLLVTTGKIFYGFTAVALFIFLIVDFFQYTKMQPTGLLRDVRVFLYWRKRRAMLDKISTIVNSQQQEIGALKLTPEEMQGAIAVDNLNRLLFQLPETEMKKDTEYLLSVFANIN